MKAVLLVLLWFTDGTETAAYFDRADHAACVASVPAARATILATVERMPGQLHRFVIACGMKEVVLTGKTS